MDKRRKQRRLEQIALGLVLFLCISAEALVGLVLG